MKTKRGEKEKLKLVILDKAVAYLKKHGRSGSGTDQIMKHIGLTRGALYSHFKSKDDLFAQAICRDLQTLEDELSRRFREDGPLALKKMIEDHLSERSLVDVGNSCVFTSLSSDMQRCKPSHRALYERYMNRIYAMFSSALKEQFPRASNEKVQAKAFNLYSSLVGTLAMARTMKDRRQSTAILDAGKRFLIKTFAPKTVSDQVETSTYKLILG
jgi:TetR/AcrR family transcriptional repressor of nem operon